MLKSCKFIKLICYIFLVSFGTVFVYIAKMSDSANHTNVAIDVNTTIADTNGTFFSEKIAEKPLSVFYSASLISFLIAFAVVLLTIGEGTYVFV